MYNCKNKNNILSLDERAFYIRTSIEDIQRIIEECLTRYKKDGNLSALKLTLDANVLVARTLEKIKEQYYTDYPPGHDYGYGA